MSGQLPERSWRRRVADLFGPRWKHSDPNVRMSRIPLLSEDALSTMCNTDPDKRVREAATQRRLALWREKRMEAALRAATPKARIEAFGSMGDHLAPQDDPEIQLLYSIASTESVSEIALAALSRYLACRSWGRVQSELRQLARAARSAEARFEALRLIIDRGFIESIANGDGDARVRAEAQALAAAFRVTVAFERHERGRESWTESPRASKRLFDGNESSGELETALLEEFGLEKHEWYQDETNAGNSVSRHLVGSFSRLADVADGNRWAALTMSVTSDSWGV